MIIIGVNGGGTKTEAICCDETGKVLGRGVAGPSNFWNIGVEASIKSINAALLQTGHPNADAICIALGGLGGQETRDRVYKKFANLYNNLTLEHDAFAELYIHRRGNPGVLVIAGTGSVVFGYDGKERYRRCTGGWFLGDGGSGYAIGREALRTTERMLLEGMKRSGIADEVMKSLNIKKESGLDEWAYSEKNTVASVAALSAAVDKAATAGDENALEILNDTSKLMAMSACEMASKIGVDTIQITGGVFKSRHYLSNFERILKLRNLKTQTVVESVAIGALYIAADRAGVRISDLK